MYLPGNHYDIGTAAKIYARQCSSTVRTLLEANSGDFSVIIQTAEKAKLNKKQREALREFQIKKDDDYEQSLWDEEAKRRTKNIIECLNAKKTPLQRLWESKTVEDEEKYKAKEKQRQENWHSLSYLERGTENDG